MQSDLVQALSIAEQAEQHPATQGLYSAQHNEVDVQLKMELQS